MLFCTLKSKQWCAVPLNMYIIKKNIVHYDKIKNVCNEYIKLNHKPP